MFKTLILTLTLTTPCAMRERSGSPGMQEAGVEQVNVVSKPAEGLSFVQSKDGTRITYDKVGKGPALVIVGGALSDRKGGGPLARELSANYSVYTYDRRGRGDSGDTKPYASEREIEDLSAIIEQAGNNAYVYGVSSGAALALHGAVRLGPDKITKLAVYEPPYGQEQAEFDAQKARVNELVNDGEPGEAAAYFLTAIGMPADDVEAMRQSPEWERVAKIDFTLEYDYVVLGNGQIPSNVTQIEVPTLVVDGTESLAFMHPTADRLAELIPEAERRTLEEQTHQAAPEVVVPVLKAFFD